MLSAARSLACVLCVSLVACQTLPAASDQGDAGSSGDTLGAESESETAAELSFTCACVELDQLCAAPEATAMQDCDLPEPCGIVEDGDPVAATCVLRLLADQQPSRFRYRISQNDGFQSEIWTGTFYILGPGEGLDNECYEEYFDLSYIHDETGFHYALEAPAYFEDCIGKTTSVMTGCIFNGLTETIAIDVCQG
jgi:hypothetical protein